MISILWKKISLQPIKVSKSPNSVKSAIPALIDKGLLTQDKGIYKVYDLFFAL
ncbi:MAG: hypothetical protein IJL37_05385 [Bacteroidaceae bacterium]|nr:hypothetical protein [Bacteroidaceae bacterium]